LSTRRPGDGSEVSSTDTAAVNPVRPGSEMKLVGIVLNRTEHLEDLLTAFLEIGVSGATVIDSVGMGRILSHDVPIFAGLRSAFPGTSPGNKTVIAITADEMVKDVMAVVEDVCGSFDEPGSGLVFVLPVDLVRGMSPAL
jgi:nitrogen regulatory protein PII